MGEIVDCRGEFAERRRRAFDEREHPDWCRALKELMALRAKAEALVGPHPGKLPLVDKD